VKNPPAFSYRWKIKLLLRKRRISTAAENYFPQQCTSSQLPEPKIENITAEDTLFGKNRFLFRRRNQDFGKIPLRR